MYRHRGRRKGALTTLVVRFSLRGKLRSSLIVLMTPLSYGHPACAILCESFFFFSCLGFSLSFLQAFFFPVLHHSILRRRSLLLFLLLFRLSERS